MKSAFHNRASRGFTLIELVLYIGIFGVVLTSFVLFSTDFLMTRAKADASAEAMWNARLAMGRMVADIRQARGYDLSASVLEINPSRLVLVTADSATNPTVYAVSAGRLTVSQGGGPALPMTSSQVTVDQFVVNDLSVAGRSRNFAIRVRASTPNDGFWVVAPSATVETTERIRRLEGFGE